jgi:hypothetical protein
MPIGHSESPVKIRRRLFAATLAVGVLILVAGSALASGSGPVPKQLGATPGVGGLTTTVRVHYVADGVDGNYGPDFLQVTGPAGTACAGYLVADDVNGPNADASGPVTLYIGPDSARDYPQGYNTYQPTYERSGKPLKRWCPGTYTGSIGFLGAGGVDDAFRFRISPTARVKPPAVETVRHLRSVQVSPGLGGRTTMFAVRYRVDKPAYDRGDVIEVHGPNRSACSGSVVRAGAWRRDGRAGPLTLHIGPGVDRNRRWKQQATAEAPVSDMGNAAPLRRWCSGTYEGTIFYENGPKFTVIARFRLTVAK